MTRTVLILGGGGMIGQKLATHLAEHGLNGERDLAVTLFDMGFADEATAPGRRLIGNLGDPEQSVKLADLRPDVIFHLAAVVSGQAEAEFSLGWQSNMMAIWHLLEALRAQHDASGGQYVPKFVFSSSIAVFGAPFPAKIDDTFLSAPQTSYGAQKAIGELMVTDFSRKGFVDGISIRLPTICVRPGKPNLAASGFFSGIIREPLNGMTAILPVADTVRHWHASPRAAIGFLTHAAGLDTNLLQGRRAISLPGVSCTVAEQIEALRQVAGNDAVALIKYEPNPVIEKIVSGWPRNFSPERAIGLGFKAESSFAEIIQVYMSDDLRRL